MRKLESKPCRICGNPVTPTKRKDRNAFWYPRQCEACKGKARDNALRIQRLEKAMSGKGNPRYRPIGSTRFTWHNGIEYCEIKVADPNIWMYKHRFIMQQKLGRELQTNEFVHHKNGNSLDNSLDNLQVMSIAQHNVHHHSLRYTPSDVASSP